MGRAARRREDVGKTLVRRGVAGKGRRGRAGRRAGGMGHRGQPFAAFPRRLSSHNRPHRALRGAPELNDHNDESSARHWPGLLVFRLLIESDRDESLC